MARVRGDSKGAGAPHAPIQSGWISVQHVGSNAARGVQVEPVHRRIKRRTLLRDEVKRALHGSRSGAKTAAAGVFKGLPWLQQRLIAHYAQPFDFFNVAMGVGDDPVARNQLCRRITVVGDLDGVRKTVNVSTGIGLLRQVFGADVNVYLRFRHPGMVTATMGP